ncbi:MAG TPA: hypothetical protein VGP48_08860 [Stellaceae bacterium]|jgi:hypothetical protein|nr:hypothetical protein [Stellaceae bacterium]
MQRRGPVSLVLALGRKKPRSLAVFLVISLTLSALALVTMPAPKHVASRPDGVSAENAPIAEH